ncbi:hypothetical protein [Actinomadura roseirufa]|uniref:hypothetical protein n=1 Tax=Actinomadura roseirufa TaxID=2094049 RepID=UPI001040FF06|nr:hypothetical protein [Actinomadura roseirufa]
MPTVNRRARLIVHGNPLRQEATALPHVVAWANGSLLPLRRPPSSWATRAVGAAPPEADAAGLGRSAAVPAPTGAAGAATAFGASATESGGSWPPAFAPAPSRVAASGASGSGASASDG